MQRKQPNEQHQLGRINRRRGQVVVIFGMLLPVLMAFMALSLDIGFTYHIKRRMQTAADAGAMGGAYEIWRGNPSLVTSAAKNDTKLNGYSDSNATVEVNNPPNSGSHAGDSGFVEVIVRQDAPTFFMRMFNRQSTTVRARAVAGTEWHVDACVIVLHPTDPATLKLNGGALLNTTCGVMVDSTDSKAIDGGGCTDAGSAGIGVSGGYSAACLSPTPSTGVPPMMDPLANMVPPTIPATPVDKKYASVNGGTVTLPPGLYDQGLKITGGTVTFSPGIYILNGGMSVSGSSILNGRDVMFYNTRLGAGAWGPISITGGTMADLHAPTSGPYEGILFWTDRNAPTKSITNSIAGSADAIYEGVFYFPSTGVAYKGGSTNTNWTVLIADTVTISGNALVQSKYSTSDVPVPLRKPTLVE